MKRSYKRIISIVLTVVILLTAAPLSGFVELKINLGWLNFSTKSSALDATGQCGENVYWNFDESTGTLTISGTGDMENYYGQSPFYRNIKIKSVVIENGVASIGDFAFYYCTQIICITIPNSVTSIGTYAFYNCTGLTSVTMGNSVTSIGMSAFEGCTGLTSVTIPDSVTKIEMSVFQNCTELTSFTIPDSITFIGGYAFSGCTGITNISIPDTVTGIASGAFSSCTGLTSITIPDSVTVIGDYAFRDCIGLSSVTIGKNLTTIGVFAFRNCTNLKNLNYNISSLKWNNNKSSFFSGCSNLDTLNIATNVKSIPAYAFYGCEKLEEVLLPESVDSIGEYSFANVKTIKIYNENCIIGENAIPFNATIYGYAGSTAEAFANENGYDFVYLGEGHEHLYDNDCDTVCNICGFTRPITHTYDNDCDDTCNICGAKRTPNHHYAWVTVTNPTTTQEGLAQKKCTVCGYVADEFTMPCLVADFVTGITVSPKTIALNAGETANITAIITPETATNKNIIWSSTDVENVTVSGGLITALLPGTSVIIAETEDGGYRDFCHVRVNSITAQNGAVVDSASGIIYGLAPKLGSIDGYVDTVDENLSVVCEDAVIGTGSVIQIIRNGETVDAFKAVIFGDVNTDGIYDGQDAFIVNCIANGLLTREQVGEAKYMAADCNHDGEVNSFDVAILEQAGLLLSRVDQTKENYAETDAYEQYLDLIDQNPASDEEAPADEPAGQTAMTIIEKIIEIIKTVILFIRSMFPKV